MSLKFGVVVFPGSNCDHDAYYSLKKILDQDTQFLWHKDKDLKNSDVVILPGGFSYGDYLRTGAIASLSPIMQNVIEFGNKGGIIIGICNGFQILLESGLLPGVLIQNNSLKFICNDVYLSVTNKNTLFTSGLSKNIIKIPIAHGDGNYFADKSTINELEKNNQIVFRYSSVTGEILDEFNPNGSINDIAGIINKNGNILGMMPHPERCCDPLLGNTDGQEIFKSIINNFIK
ncbi:MAG TPA: phosphoribosylformylglycinamidine synthase subunit PurQ [Melioribacteraceae bacterium]|nr:phosphoribosylformylglycinamidine synthase subunit PurQ [Melioribacteraceae bacterium]